MSVGRSAIELRREGGLRHVSCGAKVDFVCHVFSLYLFLPIIIFDPVLTIFSMSSRATPDLRIAPPGGEPESQSERINYGSEAVRQKAARGGGTRRKADESSRAPRGAGPQTGFFNHEAIPHVLPTTRDHYPLPPGHPQAS